MSELPKLPVSIQRKIDLKWEDLIESRGFTGDHLKWHAASDRRREAAKPPYGLAAPPPGSKTTLLGSNRQPISHNSWLELRMKEWAARESDPVVIDTIAVRETTGLAIAYFKVVVEVYLSFWESVAGNLEEFSRWSHLIVNLVEDKVSSLWREDEWHATWFDRACRPRITAEISVLRDKAVTEARGLELAHLDGASIKAVLRRARTILDASKDDRSGSTVPEVTAEHSPEASNSTTNLTLSSDGAGTGQVAELPSSDGQEVSQRSALDDTTAGLTARLKPAVTAEHDEDAIPATGSRRKGNRAPTRDNTLAFIHHRIRELRKANYSSTEEICKELNDVPRPPNAKWRDLTWIKAYRSEHKNAVKSWISRVSR